MFTKLYKAIERAQARKVAYWQLHNLSDRELKDIGISRGQIYEALKD